MRNLIKIGRIYSMVLSTLAVAILTVFLIGCPPDPIDNTPGDAEKPAAPTGFTVTGIDEAVELAWNAVDDATSYKIYRGEAAETLAEITPDSALTGTSTGYTDTGLTNGTEYFYAISAVNGAGEGARSEVENATPIPAPATPTGFTVMTGAAAGEITLMWTAVDGADSYKIYRGEAAEMLTEIMPPPNLTETDTSYTDTGLESGTEYFYAISAVNAAGTGTRSDPPVSATTLPAAPTGNFTATASTSAVAIDLSWSAVDEANSYKIYRGTDAGTLDDITPAAAPTGTMFTDNDAMLNVGTQYFYAVSAVTAAGEGAQSNVASATPVMPTSAPTAPTGLAADTDGVSGQITLTWDVTLGATEYRVYRGSQTETDPNMFIRLGSEYSYDNGSYHH